jgi:MFS family permease
MLAPFALLSFRFLWSSNLLWHLARWMEMVVVGWTVLELTNSAWAVAVVGFARNAPLLVFGLFGGVIADRFDRRHLLLVTQVVNVVTSVTLAGLVIGGGLVYWHLIAGSLVLGLSWAIDWPSRRSLIMDLVGREHLANGVILDTTSMNLTKIIGPLLGGSLIATLGLEVCFALLTVFYAGGMVLLIPLRVPAEVIVRSGSNVLRNVVDGLRYCQRNQAIVGVLAITVIMNLLTFPYQHMLPVFARDHLFVGPIGLGLLAAGDGIGSIVGSLVLLSTGHRFRSRGWLFILGCMGMNIALLGFALSGIYGLAVGMLIVAGIAHASFSAYQSTIILSRSSPEMRGRAMGALTLAIGSGPLGTLGLGATTSIVGAPAAVAANAVVSFILIGLAAIKLPELRDETRTGAQSREISPPETAGEGVTGETKSPLGDTSARM